MTTPRTNQTLTYINKIKATALCIALLGLILVSPQSANAGFSMTVDGDHLEAGELPDGFDSATTFLKGSKELAPCKWGWAVDYEERLGRTAKKRGGPAVINPVGTGFNLLISEQSDFQDLQLTVRLQPVSGKIDQGGGPIWRAKDENNYYVARWNPLEKNVRVYHVVKGKRTQIGTAENIEADTAAWSGLKVNHVGETITVTFNGEEVLKLTDSTFTESGIVGLWTKADAVTKFRGLSVGLESREGQQFSMPLGFKLIFNIESVEPGTLPTGFASATTLNKKSKGLCKWETVADPLPTPGMPGRTRNILMPTEPINSGFNVLMIESMNSQDLKMIVRMKEFSGENDQGGGLIWRAKDENNYYVARWNPLESNVRLYHVVNGIRTQIGTAENIEPSETDWRVLDIEHAGDRIKVRFDNKDLYTVTDSTFTDAGMIGLWTKDDAVTKFREIELKVGR